MKYDCFEDLPVWKAAIELAERIYLLTRHCFFHQPGDLRDQLRRSSLSVSNNIAEGFERGSTAELIAFLYIARGSAGEVRSMLHFSDRLLNSIDPQSIIPDIEISKLKSEISNLKSEISNLKSEISNLKSLAESCSRQIRAWTDSLQNSNIKGQHHLTDQTRAQYESKQRAKDFQRQIAENLHKAHPNLYPDPNNNLGSS
jgi:four helix bundle protein